MAITRDEIIRIRSRGYSSSSLIMSRNSLIVLWRFIPDYKTKMKEIGNTTELTPPASLLLVDKAIDVFSVATGIAAKKMLLLLCVSKQTGARCGDLLGLKWSQIIEKPEGLSCLPLKYKNARTGHRWRFFVSKTSGPDCPLKALSELKKFQTEEFIFGSWKTSNVDRMFTKFQNEIGGKITLHMIRVTVVYLCTAQGWADADIMQFLNWQSFESLQRYRSGADLAEIRGQKSFRSVYDDSKDAERCRQEVELWANRYKK